MSRYIDAEALIQLGLQDGAYEYVSVQEIADFPTADVVEVVRCKDCKFQGHIQRCPFGKRAMPYANGYCCYGERREDEQIH